MIAPIGDIDVAIFVHRNTRWIVKQSVRAFTVAGEGWVSREYGNGEVGTDFPNGVCVNNIEVAHFIRRYWSGFYKKSVRAHAV